MMTGHPFLWAPRRNVSAGWPTFTTPKQPEPEKKNPCGPKQQRLSWDVPKPTRGMGPPQRKKRKGHDTTENSGPEIRHVVASAIGRGGPRVAGLGVSGDPPRCGAPGAWTSGSFTTYRGSVGVDIQ